MEGIRIMTIKELADFTGKNRTTIQRWCAKCTSNITDKMQNASKENPSDFTIDEVEEILNSGSMSKDAIRILMDNARGKNLPQQINNNIDYQAIAQIVAIAVSTAMKPIIESMQMNKKDTQLLLPNVPEKTPRAIFVDKMNDFARISGKSHADAYSFVYNEIGCIYSIRVMARAKNRKCKGVDILEADGYLGKGIAVVINLIKALEEGV